MSTGKVLLGVVIGVAAGATLGVLFAPDKGSVTRKKLSREGIRGMEALKETASDYVGAIDEKIGGRLSDRTRGTQESSEPRKQRM